MNQVIIKSYVTLPTDLAQIAFLLKKETYELSNILYSPEEKMKHYEQYCSEHDRFAYLLAFESKNIVGGLTLLKRNITFDNTPIVLGGIGGFWVKKSKQRKGIGTLLMRKAMDTLKNAGCNIIYLQIEDQRLSNYYSRFGFHLLKRKHTFIGRSGKRYFQKNGMVASPTPISTLLLMKIVYNKKSLDIGKGNW